MYIVLKLCRGVCVRQNTHSMSLYINLMKYIIYMFYIFFFNLHPSSNEWDSGPKVFQNYCILFIFYQCAVHTFRVIWAIETVTTFFISMYISKSPFSPQLSIFISRIFFSTSANNLFSLFDGRDSDLPSEI